VKVQISADNSDEVKAVYCTHVEVPKLQEVGASNSTAHIIIRPSAVLSPNENNYSVESPAALLIILINKVNHLFTKVNHVFNMSLKKIIIPLYT